MRIVNYIIRPTEAWQENLPEYIDHDWAKTQIWQIEEGDYRGRGDGKSVRSAWVKIVFMLEKMISCENPSRNAVLCEKLFDNPCMYSIENFDKWWTLERVGGVYPEAFVRRLAKIEHYQKLSKTGIEGIDYYIERLIESKENE